MSRSCTRCERDQSDAATICHACSRELGKALRQIAGDWLHLGEAVGRQTQMGEHVTGKPTKRDSQPVPIDLDAMAVATECATDLAGVCRMLARVTGEVCHADTVPDAARWLDGQRKRLRMLPKAVDVCDRIIDHAGRVRRAIDIPDDPSRIKVGPCPEVGEDGEPCPGEVTAHLPKAQGVPSWMDCRECRVVWDATQWTRLGVRIGRRQQQIDQQRAWKGAA